jgi:uncharacterized protein involved in type VI secretion and phage assembly
MAEGLIETAAQPAEKTLTRVYGVAVAQVINNRDVTGLGRVQLCLPWLPGVEPWARMAGMNRGAYFIPQIGDEVLVAFHHGDVREPYVVGCLWNNLDRPPALAPTDADTKRIIHTPLGHEIDFDDLAQSLTITNSTQHTITLGKEKIEISAAGDAASITLDATGEVTIEGVSIKLKAPTTVTIEGNTNVEIKSSAGASIDGGAMCQIQAAMVKIN